MSALVVESCLTSRRSAGKFLAFLFACGTRFGLLFFLTAASAGGAQASLSLNGAELAQKYGRLPLSFEANHGQAAPEVKFLSRGSGYSLLLTDSAAVLTLSKPVEAANHSLSRKNSLVRMELAGASPEARIAGADALPGTVNYFLGNDKSKWYSDIATFAKVRYTGVYPGVDLVYYGNQRQLEYDFVVAPHVSPAAIRPHFTGSNARLNAAGDLLLTTASGTAAFHKPSLYQENDGIRHPVEGRFRLLSGNNVAFAVAPYDRSKALVIDPVLVYSTYLGGNNLNNFKYDGIGGDIPSAITLDAAGNIYLAGQTNSPDFPVSPSALQTTFYRNNVIDEASLPDAPNAFVTKLNPAGTAIIYSTYLGGAAFAGGGTLASGLAVDADGNAFIDGSTDSATYPTTPGALIMTTQGGGSFVTKLNPSGSALIYSTFLSPQNYSGQEPILTGIALDATGDA